VVRNGRGREAQEQREGVEKPITLTVERMKEELSFYKV